MTDGSGAEAALPQTATPARLFILLGIFLLLAAAIVVWR